MSEEQTMAVHVERTLNELLVTHGFDAVSGVMAWCCDLIVRQGQDPGRILPLFVRDLAAKIVEVGAGEDDSDPVLRWARSTVRQSARARGMR